MRYFPASTLETWADDYIVNDPLAGIGAWRRGVWTIALHRPQDHIAIDRLYTFGLISIGRLAGREILKLVPPALVTAFPPLSEDNVSLASLC